MATIILRNDTSSNWTSTDPVLALGEPGLDRDVNKIKIGDGSTAWSSLSYFDAPAPSLNPTLLRTHSAVGYTAQSFGSAGNISSSGNLVIGERENYSRETIYVRNAANGTAAFSITSPMPTGVNWKYLSHAPVVYGDYIAAPQRQTNASGQPVDGRVHIFSATDGSLIKSMELPAGHFTGAGDQGGFGNYGNSIGANYCIIGDRNKDIFAGNVGAGQVHLFTTAAGDWTDGVYVGSIDPPVEGSDNSNFGRTTSIDGIYAAIGDYGQNISGVIRSGAVQIVNCTTSSIIATINNPTPQEDDRFGSAVQILGNYLFIGSYREQEGATDNVGAVYIYKTTNGNWTDASQVARIVNPNANSTNLNDYFGTAITVHGNIMAINAPYEDSNTGTNIGIVYIFKTTSGDWTDTSMEYSFFQPSPAADWTGDSNIFINANYLTIGYTGGNSYQGALYQYSLY